MFSYSVLKKIAEESPDKIRDLWACLGSQQVSSITRVYLKGSLVKVSEGPLKDYIVLVQEDLKSSFDWLSTSLEAIQGFISNSQGTAVSYFKVLLSAEKFNAITSSIDYNIDLKQFEAISKYKIDDEDLTLILTRIGVPFIQLDELEYDRDQIVNTVVAPTLQYYFEKFPIIEYENKGQMSSGADFKYQFPENAHGANAFFIQGSGTGIGHASLKEIVLEQHQMGLRGNGNPFNKRIVYHKSTPGYTGDAYGGRAQAFLGQQVSQAYSNMYRREVTKVHKIDGVKYLIGHSSTGGSLEIEWMKHSYDFNDIDYEFRSDAIELAQGFAMVNFGTLRTMIRSDLPANLLDDKLLQDGQSKIDKIKESWGDMSNKLQFSIHRGMGM